YSLGDKIMAGTISPEEYGTLIAKNYIFHVEMEHALEFFLKDLQEFHSRRKTQLLLKDISELGIKNLPLKKFSAPPFTNRAEALGAMYVLEGATLGSAIIYRQLLKNREISSKSSFHYYKGYGHETGTRWKVFLRILELEIQSESDKHNAVSGAVKTFQAFEELLKM
ncbi:MAG TPA: biliverdin-producing heme oxygenase, partial [Patescibacteria group bacterium]|nr:biliverdin-producing heme oxygenase [Patescibacteria group bacterium]